MDELVAYRQGLLSALVGVVTELSKTVTVMPTNAWHLAYEPGVHTPHYTLAHLRELETQVFSSLLRRIMDEDTPLLPLFDDKVWMVSHYQSEKPAQELLEEFTNLRKKEVNWLKSLPSEGWCRTARHPWWGVHTVQWWVELQLDFSNQHLEELAAFLTM